MLILFCLALQLDLLTNSCNVTGVDAADLPISESSPAPARRLRVRTGEACLPTISIATGIEGCLKSELFAVSGHPDAHHNPAHQQSFATAHHESTSGAPFGAAMSGRHSPSVLPASSKLTSNSADANIGIAMQSSGIIAR